MVSDNYDIQNINNHHEGDTITAINHKEKAIAKGRNKENLKIGKKNLQLTILISKAWYGYHFRGQIGSKKRVWKNQLEKTTLSKNLCMNSFHKYLDK